MSRLHFPLGMFLWFSCDVQVQDIPLGTCSVTFRKSLECGGTVVTIFLGLGLVPISLYLVAFLCSLYLVILTVQASPLMFPSSFVHSLIPLAFREGYEVTHIPPLFPEGLCT